MFKW